MMTKASRVFRTALVILVVANADGCASYRTISAAERGTPKVFSGARLDVHAMLNNEYALRKFKTEPPLYPWFDLPFSLFADAMIFPLTSSAAVSEMIFE